MRVAFRHRSSWCIIPVFNTDSRTDKFAMTVAVGMSGGVDSTVAAWLLKRQGHEVVGLTMQIWDGSVALPDEGRSGCYGPGESRDLASARAVADRLGIRHFIVPLAGEYNRCVLDPFRDAYRAGRRQSRRRVTLPTVMRLRAPPESTRARLLVRTRVPVPPPRR